MLPPARRLRGSLTPQGDKSISHRALLFAALAKGESTIRGLGRGEDVAATAQCLRQLGVAVRKQGSVARVQSPGFGQWRSPDRALDCGNSGTTMRLLLGLLAAHPDLHATLQGDASLHQRPMARVTGPLRQLGADVQDTAGKAPLQVHGQQLHGADVVLPVASAQLKSAVLLAGLLGRGTTRVTEPALSRDHTERMLAGLGLPVTIDGLQVAIDGQGPRVKLPPLGEFDVPGDPSSAAFAVVAAVLHPDAAIRVRHVLLNPTRTGFVRVLERMGARLTVEAAVELRGEPVGDLYARTSDLRATDITADEVPALIDEVPILALAAAAAIGTSHWTGLGELRVKESDRLAAIVRLLALLGVPTESGPDWLRIHGLGSARAWIAPAAAFVPGLDHRMAMSAAVAGLASCRAVEVTGFAEAVASSWPGFVAAMTRLAR